MKHRTFGRTGIEVSEIGFGAWQIGGSWGEVGEADGRAALEAALDAGMTFVDTDQSGFAKKAKEAVLASAKEELKPLIQKIYGN